ncbi:MAG: GTP 3',8-cyclase MoaA [Candidatus Aureabacteria bacterium]|nr:GTP 3',8-cyclase MoaA [Candidatus Auribacterota bacterium]
MMPSPEPRKVDYLRISVTDLCNLRCVYCLPPEGVAKIAHQEILTFEEILKVVKAAVVLGIRHFRLTGGDPLVRKGILDLVREMGRTAGIEDLTLTTNGLLLDRFAADLKKAGVKRLNVSLDSVNPETFRRITRGGDLAAVLAGLRAAREAGFAAIKLNAVVLKGINDGEVFELLDYAREGGHPIRFIELMPISVAEVEGENRYLPVSELRQRIEEKIPLETEGTKPGCGPAEYFRSRDGRLLIGFIAPISRAFCLRCNRVRLTAEGKLRPCLSSDWELDLRAVVRGGGGEEKIRELLSRAIAGKPAAHRFGEKGVSRRKMVSIGG